MSMSSLALDAFTEVARCQSFSLAAEKLHVTQSALSQRVLNLEQHLGSALFIRIKGDLRLTPLGQRLLRYTQARELLEGEFMADLKTDVEGLGGNLRLAGFSSVTRSLVLPILGPLLRKNPKIHFELLSGELRDLPPMLFSGQADFIFLTTPLDKQGIENHLLGYEENVLITSSAVPKNSKVYIDHDEEDRMSFDFLKHQGQKSPQFQRHYLDEIYSVVDGVQEGLGRAVVPRHLVAHNRAVREVPGYKALKVPIYISYYAQSFYTQLQQIVLQEIREGFAQRLRAP